jgi:hypothetical protein
MKYPLDNKTYGHGKHKPPPPTIEELLDLPKPPAEPWSWTTIGPGMKIGIKSLQASIYSIMYGSSYLKASEFNAPYGLNCATQTPPGLFVKGLNHHKPLTLDLPSLATVHGVPGIYPPPFIPENYPLDDGPVTPTKKMPYVKKSTLVNKALAKVTSGLDDYASSLDLAAGSFSVTGSLTTHFSDPTLYDYQVKAILDKKQTVADELMSLWNMPLQPAQLNLLKQHMSVAEYAKLYEATYTSQPYHDDAMHAESFYSAQHLSRLNRTPPPQRKPEDILDDWAAGPKPRNKKGLWYYQQEAKSLAEMTTKHSPPLDPDLHKALLDKYYAPPKPMVITKDMISDPSLPIMGTHADLVIMDDVQEPGVTTTAHKSQGTDWSGLEMKVLKGIMEDLPMIPTDESHYIYSPQSINPCEEITLTPVEPTSAMSKIKWYPNHYDVPPTKANEASVSDFEL